MKYYRQHGLLMPTGDLVSITNCKQNKPLVSDDAVMMTLLCFASTTTTKSHSFTFSFSIPHHNTIIITPV
jgi:hypothetical protein